MIILKHRTYLTGSKDDNSYKYHIDNDNYEI